MASIYRLTFKSQENRGATQPNIVELQFASDADAIAFGHNVELCGSLHLVSVDVMLSSNYALPYPAGSDGMVRVALTDASGLWNQLRVYDIVPAFAPLIHGPLLIAAGIETYDRTGAVGAPVVTANFAPFLPGPSI